MADLKTTIAQTENLKNKVKLAKQRINETVVRGGGITSKSLSEIPDNINKMLGQYNKVASGTLSSGSISTKGKSFTINLSFVPKRIIVLIVQHKSGSGGGAFLNYAADSSRNYSESSAYWVAGGSRGCYITNVTQNGFFIGTGSSISGDNGLTIYWTALG